MKTHVFWDVTPCLWASNSRGVEGFLNLQDQPFQEEFFSHCLILKMKAQRFFETPPAAPATSHCHIPKDKSLKEVHVCIPV
jgi:hypothetical protein